MISEGQERAHPLVKVQRYKLKKYKKNCTV